MNSVWVCGTCLLKSISHRGRISLDSLPNAPPIRNVTHPQAASRVTTTLAWHGCCLHARVSLTVMPCGASGDEESVKEGLKLSEECKISRFEIGSILK